MNVAYWRQERRVAYNARRAEAHRRVAVWGVFAIYLLSMLEGPLRKWLLPELSSPLIFLRDPFVALLYVYCFCYRLFATGPLARLWLAMGVVTSLFGLLQYQFNSYDPLAWGLGVRAYWLYVPLAFLIARTFRREDVDRFLLWNVILAVPYALLVAAQYNSPPTAWVNLGVGGDDASVIGVDGDIFRPFGVFSFTAPNVDFTAASVAIFIAFFLSGTRVPLRAAILCVCGLAVAAMAVLTGSRTIYFLVASIVGLTLVGSTIARPDGRTLLRNLGVLLFVAMAAALLVNVFSDMYAAMGTRFESAAEAEGSIWDRALGVAFAFVDPMYTAPVLGSGIGLGAPGVSGYLGLPNLFLGENDFERNMNELGVIAGTMLIILRLLTAAWLVSTAVSLARRGLPIALPLAGYAMVPIAIGQITNSPLSAFMPWLVVGLVASLARQNSLRT